MNDIEEEDNFVNMLNKIVSYINWDSGKNKLNNFDFWFDDEDDEGDCVRILYMGLWCNVFCFNIYYVFCF